MTDIVISMHDTARIQEAMESGEKGMVRIHSDRNRKLATPRILEILRMAN